MDMKQFLSRVIHRTRRKSGLVRAALLIWLCVGIWEVCVAPANAASRSWTGDGPLVGGAYRLWSDADNWNPQGVPQNGDELSFHEYNFTAGSTTTFNDLPNLTVHSLTIWYQADFLTHEWTLHGNTLGISHDILLYFTTGQDVHINCGLRLEGNVLVTVDNESELYMNGPVDLNGHDLSLEVYDESVNVFYYGGLAEFSGPISGNGNIHLYPSLSPNGGGGGILRINGTVGNTFIGTFRQHSKLMINGTRGAELVLDKQGGLAIPGALMISTNCVTKLARANQLADNAPVRITAGGRLLLGGHADAIGSLHLTNTANATAATQVDTGGAVLSVLGDITAVNHGPFTPTIIGRLELPSGAHTFNVSGSVYEGLNMQAQMLGFGNFSKSGTAALLLTASNSFNSTISILQGVLDVRNNHALGDTAGSTEIFEGNLTLRNVAIGGELLFALGGSEGEFPGSVLTSIGLSSWSGQVLLNTNLVVTGDMTFTGPISGAGGLGCFGGGTIRLGGALANTYTGTTLVRCPLLELKKPFGIHAYRGPLVVGGGFGGRAEARWINSYQTPSTPLTLFANGFVNLSTNVEDFGPVTFNGGLVQSTSGSFITYNSITANPATTPAVINGSLALSVSPAFLIVSNGAAEPDLLINAVISGANIIKQGAGTLSFASANTFSGALSVQEGILHADNSGAFGSTLGNTYVAPNATIRLGGVDGLTEAFQLDGPGLGGTNGALQITVGGTTTGNIHLLSPSTIHTTSGSLAINAIISGTGPLTKTGVGNLFLGGTTGGSGNNSYTGDTIVGGGTLYLSKNQGVIAVPGNLIVGTSPTGPSAIARFNRSGTMNASAIITVNANSLLDLNGNNQTLPRLNLNDGGDVQTGSGTLSFTAGGIIAIGTLNAPGVGLRRGSSFSGNIALPVLDYLTFDISPYGAAPFPGEGPELDIPAVIRNGGNIIKVGQGAVRLSGANTFNDAPPNFAGDLFVNAGTVIAAHASALGGTAGWTFVNNSASLALVGGISINGENLYLNSDHARALDNIAGNNTWTGPISLTRDTTIASSLDWSLTTPGVIGGAGSLMKVGPGVLWLSGAANNTHAGDTFVHEGWLGLSKSAFVQAVPHNLVIGRPTGGAFAAALHVSTDQIWGHVTVNAGGGLNLNGYNEYIGNLTLNGGGDVFTGNGTLHLTTVSVNPGAFADQSLISGRLGLNASSVPVTVGAGAIAGGAAQCLISASIVQSAGTSVLLKVGGGRLQLTGTNTYTGVTYVGDGALQVDGVQPQSAVELDHDTRLQGVGTVGHILFNGTTAIAPGASAGTLTCSNFDASGGAGNLEIELNGHPTGYDQIVARGLVDLRGLALQASLNFISSTGQQFMLINNDGADAVTGTFTGLPQNTPLTIGNESFVISYTGGTGNDVVLTRTPTPPRPKLEIEHLPPGSVRLKWPTNFTGYTLQFSTNLSATNWSTATPPPVITGTNRVVTNSTANSPKFYRLKQ